MACLQGGKSPKAGPIPHLHRDQGHALPIFHEESKPLSSVTLPLSRVFRGIAEKWASPAWKIARGQSARTPVGVTPLFRGIGTDGPALVA
jgi:hypothetical protein